VFVLFFRCPIIIGYYSPLTPVLLSRKRQVQAPHMTVSASVYFWLAIGCTVAIYTFVTSIYSYIGWYTFQNRSRFPRGNVKQVYVVNKTLAQDLHDAGFKSSMSAYSTNVMRANQALMVSSLLVPVVLTLLLGFNDALAPVAVATRSSAYVAPIFIGYFAFLLVGTFPSSDVTVDPESGVPRRDFNAVMWGSIDTQTSGLLHTLGALGFLYVPAVTNIIYTAENLNVYDDALTFLVLTCVGLFFTVAFNVIQLILSYGVSPAQAEDNHHSKIGNLYWFSYVCEQIAFSLTVFTYFYIEITLIRKNLPYPTPDTA